ncbi:MAG: D-alanyl-D-alanine carboxypeptidase [Acidimicrobiaceae bacterium]|nr:D-alanyl-D-alanine carboxypeptidase [Acidimicrobiaceae bacterium]
MRRILVSILLAALATTAIGSYVQARRIDADSDPGWVSDTGPPEMVVSTPLLSVRRTPSWLSGPVTEARLFERLSGVAALPAAPPQTCLAAYRNGEHIMREQAEAPLVPSSLMKIVTAAVILETAGPAATFTTEAFVRTEDLNAAVDGVFTGDIYLVGRGDPVLSTVSYIRRFPGPIAYTDFTDLAVQAAASLRDRGISRVEGSVLADESRFPEAERDYSSQIIQPDNQPIWKQSYVNSNQVGPLSALLLNDGYVSFPASADYASRRENVRATDPALHAAQVLDGLIEARGVGVSAQAGKGTAPPRSELHSLGSIESPPMGAIVARMLRYSDNTTAEMLLKDIGRRFHGSARAEAVTDVHDVLERLLGIPTEGIVIADGSGLSLHNRLTCDLITRLLLQAGPDSPLVRGLAVVGESGTLRDCEAEPEPAAEAGAGTTDGLADSVLDGPVWAKSGTLNDVSALAGVTVARNGDVLTFALISNREGLIFDLGFCNELQRGLIAAAAGHPYGPSSADALLHPQAARAPVIDTPPDPDGDT